MNISLFDSKTDNEVKMTTLRFIRRLTILVTVVSIILPMAAICTIIMLMRKLL